MGIRIFILSVVFSSFFLQKSLSQNSVHEALAPKWVEQIDYSLNDNSDQSPFKYLVYDRQQNAVTQEHFFHFVVQIFNSEGVQEMSSISVNYDPSYQELVIHKIVVHRGDESQNRQIDGYKILQQENDLQRALYNGSLTFIKDLLDIRKGDILEYSYTIKGLNPIYGTDKFASFYQNFEIPIDRVYQKYISDQKMNLNYLGGASVSDVRNNNNQWIYTWDFSAPKVSYIDYTLPTDIEQSKIVQLSSMHDWNDVAVWANSLYTLPLNEKSELKSILSKYFTLEGSEKNILNAIRFVQDEIRYLGFEDGISAFKPHQPVKVLEQRFGDCKDKSFLLASILSEMNINASPVLVNSEKREGVENMIPSPLSFDHCIVAFEINNNTYVIDPTIPFQGGDLSNLSTPLYGKGLRINQNSNDLFSFKEKVIPQIRIQEEFKLDSIGGAGVYDIITTYTGRKANNQRAYFNGNSRTDIKKYYEQYYEVLYPNIENTALEFFDSTRANKNEIIVKETYQIKNIWEEKDNVLHFNLFALSLNDILSPGTPQEEPGPYSLGLPVEYIQNTTVHLPEEWNLENTETKINNANFDYISRINYSDQKIHLHYRYYLKKERIDSLMVNDIIKDVEKLPEDIGYELTYDKSLLNFNNHDSISIVAWLMILIGLMISFFMVRWLYYKYDPIPENSSPGLAIGGWLILPAIGLIVSPLRILIESVTSLTDGSYSASTFSFLWNDTSLEYSQELLGLICVELLVNVLLFSGTIVIAILFFKKRSSVPKLMVAYFGITFLVLFIDSLLADMFVEESMFVAEDIFKSLIAACIWIPYFIVSKRVKNTFVHQLNPRATFLEEEE